MELVEFIAVTLVDIVRPVHFDVALTASESVSGGARAGIQVAVLGASGGAENRRGEERISRIRFRVEQGERVQ